ncbi:MAG: toxin ParE1/3/4 [Sphingomonadales bacterium]|nr:toxin ParE1/3/4 [Sphingomonadales bacterium]
MRELVYRPLARDDLAEIYLRRAEIDGFDSAAELVSAIQDRCEGLTIFSERGTPRPEIGPGVRSVPFGRKAVIAYVIEAEVVVVVGIMYGGRDLSALQEPGRLP